MLREEKFQTELLTFSEGGKMFQVRRSVLSAERESYVKKVKNEIKLDCSLGTNPFGFPSIKINLSGIDISKYPDPYNSELREAIANYWDISENEIFIGAGSMGCLEKINKFAITDGTKVFGYAPQFSEYITEVKIMGGKYEYILLKKEKNFKFDPMKFLAKVGENYSVIYIDNPNNPTGQVIPLDIIEDIIKKTKGIVIVDEAYGDFMEDRNSAINLEYDNLIVVRSFSKGFGLANLRVGYVVIKGKELKKLYEKVNPPFQISSIAEKFAIEALRHEEFVKESRKKIRMEKEKLMKGLERLGFNVAETHMEVPIFLLCKEGVNLYEWLLKKGILTVNGRDFIGLDESCVRVRIPPKAEIFMDFLFSES